MNNSYNVYLTNRVYNDDTLMVGGDYIRIPDSIQRIVLRYVQIQTFDIFVLKEQKDNFCQAFLLVSDKRDVVKFTPHFVPSPDIEENIYMCYIHVFGEMYYIAVRQSYFDTDIQCIHAVGGRNL